MTTTFRDLVAAAVCLAAVLLGAGAASAQKKPAPVPEDRITIDHLSAKGVGDALVTIYGEWHFDVKRYKNPVVKLSYREDKTYLIGDGYSEPQQVTAWIGEDGTHGWNVIPNRTPKGIVPWSVTVSDIKRYEFKAELWADDLKQPLKGGEFKQVFVVRKPEFLNPLRKPKN